MSDDYEVDNVETLNEFLVGAKVEQIVCYEQTFQIVFTNGAFLVVTSDSPLRQYLYGPTDDRGILRMRDIYGDEV